MIFLARHLEKCPPVKGTPSVNLIGISVDDYRSRSDIESIRRMLEPKVKLNAVLPMMDETAMARFAGATLNVVFRGFEAVGEALKDALGMAYIVVDYPYGLEGSVQFLNAVDQALGVDHTAEIEVYARQVKKSAGQALHPLRLIYQAEVAVAADYMRAEAMSLFLSRELGLRVVAQLDDRESDADLDAWMDQVCHSGAVLAFGSSFQRQVEDVAPVKLIRFAYPVMDAMALGYQPYAGFDGLNYLLSDIFNGVMTVPYRRHGRFNP